MPTNRHHLREFRARSRCHAAWRLWMLSTCIAFAWAAHAQQPFQMRRVVPVAEQQARDSDRAVILREELARLEAWLQTLARRKAERAAAIDIAGVDDIEEQRLRTLGDIAAVRRELDATSSAPHAVVPTARARPASASIPPPVAHWWDVYRKTQRPAPAPPPSSHPESEAEARHASTPHAE